MHKLTPYWLWLFLSACGGKTSEQVVSDSAQSNGSAGVTQDRGEDETVTGSAGDSAVPPAESACPTQEQIRQQMLATVNLARAEARECGDTAMPAVAALSWNERLTQAAYRHSADMANYDFFSHTGLDGGSVSTRASEHGYDWRWVGENLAAGQSTVAQVVAGWLTSPGHCRNLMKEEFVEMGAACEENDDSHYRYYWTQVLAQPQE